MATNNGRLADWDGMPEWITTEEAAEQSGFHPEYIRQLARSGKIGAEKRGGRDWWIDKDKLREFLLRRRPRGRPVEHTGG